MSENALDNLDILALWGRLNTEGNYRSLATILIKEAANLTQIRSEADVLDTQDRLENPLRPRKAKRKVERKVIQSLDSLFDSSRIQKPETAYYFSYSEPKLFFPTMIGTVGFGLGGYMAIFESIPILRMLGATLAVAGTFLGSIPYVELFLNDRKQKKWVQRVQAGAYPIRAASEPEVAQQYIKAHLDHIVKTSPVARKEASQEFQDEFTKIAEYEVLKQMPRRYLQREHELAERRLAMLKSAYVCMTIASNRVPEVKISELPNTRFDDQELRHLHNARSDLGRMRTDCLDLNIYTPSVSAMMHSLMLVKRSMSASKAFYDDVLKGRHGFGTPLENRQSQQGYH